MPESNAAAAAAGPQREDTVKPCAACGHHFVFTAGERQYFADRRLHEPRRCKPCRALAKAQRAAQPSSTQAKQ